MDERDEMLIESARLIARLAVSLKIHKRMLAEVELLETHPDYAAEMKRFQQRIAQMEILVNQGNSPLPSDQAAMYGTLREILAIGYEPLR